MTPDELQLRDEILQVMYWRRGEGFGEDADGQSLSIFLPNGEDSIQALLGTMERDGLLKPSPTQGSYRLSDLGSSEGGRRFADAFADAGLGGQAHGMCAPGCDCELHGPEYCSHHGHDHSQHGEHPE